MFVLRAELQNAGAEIRTLCAVIVKDFIGGYYPSVTVHTQLFYRNRDFMDAVALMESGAWSDAIDKLKPVSKYGKNKTKGKACFNIAVCYKFMGDNEETIKWYGQAIHYLGRAPWFELPY